MKLYFVISGTADNYIMSVMEDGVRCHSCEPNGMFAGVDLYTYDELGEKIPGETIAKRIAAAVDPDLCGSDLDWMGDPCFDSFDAWEAFQSEQEYFNQDEEFLVGEYPDC